MLLPLRLRPCPLRHPRPKGRCLLCYSLGYHVSHALPLHCMGNPFVLVMFMLSVRPAKLTEATETNSCLFLALQWHVKEFCLNVQKEPEKRRVYIENMKLKQRKNLINNQKLHKT